MKVIAIERYGGPGELVKRGLPRPEPREDELLIQVVAAGVSRLDTTACRGELRDSNAVMFPWVPGFEIAGVVEQLGAGCRRFRAGDRVCALLPDGGGFAQFALAKEDLVMPVPASLLFEEAAGLPLDGCAAWYALFGEDRNTGGSSTVAVCGASTGAGHLAVQLALGAGARLLAAAPEEHRSFVERLGRVEWFERDCDADLRINAAHSHESDDGWIDLSGGGGSLQARLVRDGAAEPLTGLPRTLEQRRVRPWFFKILNFGSADVAYRLVEDDATYGKLALTL